MQGRDTLPSGVTGQGETTMKNDAQVATAQISTTDTSLISLLGAVMLGLGLLFASGLAQASVMHDTAHDQRHAMAFPCH